MAWSAAAEQPSRRARAWTEESSPNSRHVHVHVRYSRQVLTQPESIHVGLFTREGTLSRALKRSCFLGKVYEDRNHNLLVSTNRE